MNAFQDCWWRQAKSDLQVLRLLRVEGADACHQLHYLQMVTEKISKAYFWRSNQPPARSHAGFCKFMRLLLQVPTAQQSDLARIFGFNRFDDFQGWLRSALVLVYELERLAPALAGDGPNPEYPWPQAAPVNAPASYSFQTWENLCSTGRGRQLLLVIEAAVEQFPVYA